MQFPRHQPQKRHSPKSPCQLHYDRQQPSKKSGIEYLLKKFNSLTIVTKNISHPAFKIKSENLKIISYKNEINFIDLFKKLKNEYKIDAITIQSGGTLNSVLLRNKLIDKISIVVAPALIGGQETPSLIGGKSLASIKELKSIKALELVEVKKLNNSYIHLKYNVINDTVIEQFKDTSNTK